MRERKIVLAVGAQGTGKSSIAKAFAGAAMQRREPVVVLSPAGWGNVPLPADPEAYARGLLDRGWRGLLVVDDADRLIDKRISSQSPWRLIALTGRHLGVDLLLTARRPQELPDVILSGVDLLICFQTSAADVNGIKRLREIAPGLRIPDRPYVFTAIEPKTATGNMRTGRTLPGGGYKLGE